MMPRLEIPKPPEVSWDLQEFNRHLEDASILEQWLIGRFRIVAEQIEQADLPCCHRRRLFQLYGLFANAIRFEHGLNLLVILACVIVSVGYEILLAPYIDPIVFSQPPSLVRWDAWTFFILVCLNMWVIYYGAPWIYRRQQADRLLEEFQLTLMELYAEDVSLLEPDLTWLHQHDPVSISPVRIDQFIHGAAWPSLFFHLGSQ